MCAYKLYIYIYIYRGVNAETCVYADGIYIYNIAFVNSDR